eukprot:scaffold84795_cov39-Phaeocystis_antarctica.AAC.1
MQISNFSPFHFKPIFWVLEVPKSSPDTAQLGAPTSSLRAILRGSKNELRPILRGGTARAAAGRGTSPRSPRLDVARSLIICISFALTSSLLHEITT